MQTALVLALVCVGAHAQFSEGGKQSMVNAHNAVRSSIAKGEYVAKGTKKDSATNMLKMKWDNSLAQSAQNYANGCPMQHSPDKSYGENLFWAYSSSPITDLDKYVQSAVDTWVSEFQMFGWNSNKFTTALWNTGIGHATQVAWSATGQVGCGAKNCGADSVRVGSYKATIVCQYKVPGNYLFKNIYNSGAKCSACPAGTSCEQSSGLCA